MASGVWNISRTKLHAEIVDDGNGSISKHRYTYNTAWTRQFTVLLWRALTNKFRDIAPVAIMIFQALFLSVLLSLIYMDVKLDQDGI